MEIIGNLHEFVGGIWGETYRILMDVWGATVFYRPCTGILQLNAIVFYAFMVANVVTCLIICHIYCICLYTLIF